MQENTFALRKTLKKVAAIGTSLAMVGVTLSGAMAAGLSDYGSTFSRSNTVVVFGEAGTDSVAVSDVVAGLPGAAASTAGEVVAGALSIDDFEQGERENFEPGNNLNDTAAFGTRCFTDTDSSGLTDWEQNIDISTDADYDVHEEFCFSRGAATVKLTTSLHEVDDDLGIEPVVFMPSGGLNYSIIFEEDLPTGNRFANASTADEIILESFLGGKLLITGANVAGSQITALVGNQFQVHSGDTVVSEECNLELIAVDTSTVHVNVNGTPENIDEGESKRVTDSCEVYVSSVIETTDGEGIAILFLGDQAAETFTDGDHYSGEDKNHFLWEWDLAHLQNARPLVGVILNENMQSDRVDLEDEIMDLGLLRANRRHLAVGDYICLPNYHQCLILEGPNAETERCTIDFSVDKKDLPGTPANTAWFGAESTYGNAEVLRVEASGCGSDKGLRVTTDAGASYSTETDTVYLFRDANLLSNVHNDAGEGGAVADSNTTYGELLLYYENTNSNITGPFNLSARGLGYDAISANGTFATEGKLFEIDNDDFDNLEVNLWSFVNSTSGATRPHDQPVRLDTTGTSGLAPTNSSVMALLRVELDDEGATTDGTAPSLWFEVGFDSATTNGIDRMGAIVGEDTYKWVRYAVNATGGGSVPSNSSISDFDNDVVSNSGIIVKDMESLYDSDGVQLDVPNDDKYEWWVRVAKTKEGVVSTGGSVVSSSVSMSDQEVGDVNTLGKNVVAVGGPAVNEVAAELLGVDFPTYGSGLAGLEEGTAVLEMKSLSGGKQAVLVYGWEQDDTRRAAVLLRDPSVLSQKLEDAGLGSADSATVTGTDFSVAGITVSA